MSELIDNDTERRKDLLKHLILQLHVGAAAQGHPVHVFQQENAALRSELDGLDRAAAALEELRDEDAATEVVLAVRARLNALADQEEHVAAEWVRAESPPISSRAGSTVSPSRGRRPRAP